MNPSLTQHQLVFLVSSDKLFINSVDFLVQNLPATPASSKVGGASASRTPTKCASTHAPATSNKILNYHFSNMLQVNKQWLVIPLPSAYLATNWPPRCAAVNDNGMQKWFRLHETSLYDLGKTYGIIFCCN